MARSLQGTAAGYVEKTRGRARRATRDNVRIDLNYGYMYIPQGASSLTLAGMRLSAKILIWTISCEERFSTAGWQSRSVMYFAVVGIGGGTQDFFGGERSTSRAREGR